MNGPQEEKQNIKDLKNLEGEKVANVGRRVSFSDN